MNDSIFKIGITDVISCCKFHENTVFLPCNNDAMNAVTTLLQHNSAVSFMVNFSSRTHPSAEAAKAARKPSTVA